MFIDWSILSSTCVFKSTNSLEADSTCEIRSYSPQGEVDASLEKNGFFFSTLETSDTDQHNILIQSILSQAPFSRSALWLFEFHLRQYCQDALRLPINGLKIYLRDNPTDPVQLASYFKVDIPTAMRRLVVLPASINKNLSGLVICDAAGSFVFLKPVDGFRIQRYMTACPLWTLFEALQMPMRPIYRNLQQPSIEAEKVQTISYAHLPETLNEDNQALPYGYMFITVLQKELSDGKLVQLGASCALCLREDCKSRRELSLLSDEFP